MFDTRILMSIIRFRILTLTITTWYLFHLLWQPVRCRSQGYESQDGLFWRSYPFRGSYRHVHILFPSLCSWGLWTQNDFKDLEYVFYTQKEEGKDGGGKKENVFRLVKHFVSVAVSCIHTLLYNRTMILHNLLASSLITSWTSVSTKTMKVLKVKW